MNSPLLSVEQLIPGGILSGDWPGAHCQTDTGECSRCGRTPAEQEVPLLLWTETGKKMLRYCDWCLAQTPDKAIKEDPQNYYRNVWKSQNKMVEKEK